MIVFLFYAEKTIILHDLKYNWYGKLDYGLCFWIKSITSKFEQF